MAGQRRNSRWSTDASVINTAGAVITLLTEYAGTWTVGGYDPTLWPNDSS
jgi:hypothetical protein